MKTKERLHKTIEKVEKKKRIVERSKKRYKSKLDLFLDSVAINEIYSILYFSI